MLLSFFYADYYLPLKLRGRSLETDRLYRLSLKSFEKTLGRLATLDDLTDMNLSRHLHRLSVNGRAAATINKDRAQILAIWRFAAQKRFVAEWPNVPEEVEPKRIPKAWMPEELSSLIAAALRQTGMVGDNQAAEFWRALVLTILDTGERIGAVLQCEWSDLDGPWLNMRAELRKGRRKDKQYQLSDDVLRAIHTLKKNKKVIFPWPLHKTYIFKRFGKICKQAGLPADRKSKFHRLRKTVASACMVEEIDPQFILDHTDRRTTEMYLDPRIAKQPQATGVIARYLASKAN